MSKYLDSNGLLYFWTKLKTLIGGKVDKVDGKGLSTNDYTTAEKTKLAGIEANANNYILPTASASTLGGIKVGANLTMTDGVLSAVQGTYTLPTASTTTKGGIKVGTNLSIDSSTGVLSATDTTYSDATTSAHGLMTAADKTKLNGIAENANNYSLPTASASTLGGVKVGTNLSISSGVLSATDTTYSDATTSVHGLMTSEDKTKLNGIEENANNYTLPTASTNSLGGVKTTSTVVSTSGLTACPIIGGNVYYKDTNTTYSTVTTSKNGLMSSTDKTKLDGFSASSNYALKTDITGVYKYKGSVVTYADLPSTGVSTGDVYNVESNGQNYAWTGSAWDSLGEIFQITDISNSDIDTIMAS